MGRTKANQVVEDDWNVFGELIGQSEERDDVPNMDTTDSLLMMIHADLAQMNKNFVTFVNNQEHL